MTAAGNWKETGIAIAPDSSEAGVGAEYSGAARNKHARWPLDDLSKTTKVLFGHELSGNRESASLVVGNQYQFAPAQSCDCFAEGTAVKPQPGRWRGRRKEVVNGLTGRT